MIGAPRAYASGPPLRMEPPGTGATTGPSRARRTTTASIDTCHASANAGFRLQGAKSMPGSPASCCEVLPQSASLVGISEAATTAQFGHKEVDDAKQIARGCHWVREHKAAAASGRLEHLFHVVGDLSGGAGDGAVVGGCAFEPVLKEFFARDLCVCADVV